MAGRIVGNRITADVINGGSASVSGTITEVNAPGQYRVRLHEQQTGVVVRETWSNAAGHYEFNNLSTTPKYIVAFDHTNPLQNAAIQDKVIPS